mmetsp:Transcript_79907/g.175252  ORF Transcript_79907/g.175252 Transcript_79907/m.175252 type:complete len:288 (+) Transcript_79907:821-1684(+)
MGAGSASPPLLQARAKGSAPKPPSSEEPDAKRPRFSPPSSPSAEDNTLGGDFGFAGSGSPDVYVAPPSPFPTGPVKLESLSISKLKSLARYHGVSLAGCLEKSEIVRALRKGNVDDAAAERMQNSEGAGGGGPSAKAAAPPPARTSDEQKAQDFAARRAVARAAEAEQRAAAAEEEANRLREQLAATQNSDAKKKKWTPAFASTPFVASAEPAHHNNANGHGNGQSERGPSGFGFSHHAFRPGTDVRWKGNPNGGGGAAGGEKIDQVCWEYRKGTCMKGVSCKWQHI